jgi:transcriptional regulator with XRE-family HTH domain
MIHRALKLIRQFHEITQTDLSSQLGLSKSYLSEIESGKKTVTFDLINKYSEIFDIPSSSLVFFSESISTKGKLSDSFRTAASGSILNIFEWFMSKGNSNGSDNKIKVM